MADPLTWTQVADTAVKIGLSGLVGGVSAYWLAKRSQKHELDREYLRRKQDIIREVSAGFAPISRLFLEVAADYHSLVEYAATGMPIANPTQDKYSQYFRDIGDALHKLHLLEADLLLVGATEATDCLRRYRLQAAEINNSIELRKSDQTKATVESIIDELARRRELFYHTLANSFKAV